MIAEHGATVLSFTDALLRAPKDQVPRASALDQAGGDEPPPDNVIVLARFSSRARRPHGPLWLVGPPGGDAA
jgi:hypothetical protein